MTNTLTRPVLVSVLYGRKPNGDTGHQVWTMVETYMSESFVASARAALELEGYDVYLIDHGIPSNPSVPFVAEDAMLVYVVESDTLDLPFRLYDGAGNLLAMCATRAMAEALKPVLEADPSCCYI